MATAVENIAGVDVLDRPLESEMTLSMGPQHPSTHGVLRLALTIDGEKIIRADPIIGYMHRGADSQSCRLASMMICR